MIEVEWQALEGQRADIRIILERAKELHPEARPRIISDNGPRFIAKDFKEFIRISGMTHVRTSPYCPQSNGKIERWHKSLKGECIRPGTPLSLGIRGLTDYSPAKAGRITSLLSTRTKNSGEESCEGLRSTPGHGQRISEPLSH